jgi:orotidine-5'-phosphate decarboxylase
MFKVGKQLFTAEGPNVVRGIRISGGRVFLDLKFKDIPNTVAGAADSATRLGISMFNVHCDGGFKMMEAAAKAAEKTSAELGIACPVVLGVTVLTSMDYPELCGVFPLNPDLPADEQDRFIRELVLSRAALARKAGLHGVVASPREAKAVREACGANFTIVTPGIRPTGVSADDQVRIDTPRAAITAGSDYLVIGRPITEAVDPVEAAKRINDEVAAALA